MYFIFLWEEVLLKNKFLSLIMKKYYDTILTINKNILFKVNNLE